MKRQTREAVSGVWEIPFNSAETIKHFLEKRAKKERLEIDATDLVAEQGPFKLVLVGKRGEPPGLPCILSAAWEEAQRSKGFCWEWYVEAGEKTDSDMRDTLERLRQIQADPLEGTNETKGSKRALCQLLQAALKAGEIAGRSGVGGGKGKETVLAEKNRTKVGSTVAGRQGGSGGGSDSVDRLPPTTAEERETIRRCGTKVQKALEYLATTALSFPHIRETLPTKDVDELEKGGRPCREPSCFAVTKNAGGTRCIKCGGALGNANQDGPRLRPGSKKGTFATIKWSGLGDGRNVGLVYTTLEALGLLERSGRGGGKFVEPGLPRKPTSAGRLAPLLRDVLLEGGLEAYLSRPTGGQKKSRKAAEGTGRGDGPAAGRQGDA